MARDGADWGWCRAIVTWSGVHIPLLAAPTEEAHTSPGAQPPATPPSAPVQSVTYVLTPSAEFMELVGAGFALAIPVAGQGTLCPHFLVCRSGKTGQLNGCASSCAATWTPSVQRQGTSPISAPGATVGTVRMLQGHVG